MTHTGIGVVLGARRFVLEPATHEPMGGLASTGGLHVRSKEQSVMIKLGVAILGMMTVPLFGWLMAPALMVIAALFPFVVVLGALMLACTPPRRVVKAPVTAKHALSEPELAAHTA
jgi:hypothetical protein